MATPYWSHFKAGRRQVKLGPFETREEAIEAALRHTPMPKHRTLSTGYGADGGHFDIRWHDDRTREGR